MQYHCFARLLDNQWYGFWNTTEEEVKNKMLIPFVNGQVLNITHASTGKQILLNFKTLVAASIYRTENPIEIVINEEGFPTFFISDTRYEFDCTNELIKEVKESKTNYRITSILEKSFASLSNQIFVIMNFHDKYLASAYSRVIKPVAKQFYLQTVMINEIEDSRKIDAQILEHLAQSKYVLCDLTGERPNCYYEAGFAHALGKELILTIRKGSTIHFDLRGYRFIIWDTEQDFSEQLNKRLAEIV